MEINKHTDTEAQATNAHRRRAKSDDDTRLLRRSIGYPGDEYMNKRNAKKRWSVSRGSEDIGVIPLEKLHEIHGAGEAMRTERGLMEERRMDEERALIINKGIEQMMQINPGITENGACKYIMEIAQKMLEQTKTRDADTQNAQASAVTYTSETGETRTSVVASQGLKTRKTAGKDCQGPPRVETTETDRNPIQARYIGDDEEGEHAGEAMSEQEMSTQDMYEMDWSSVQTDSRREEARNSVGTPMITDDGHERQRAPSQYEKEAMDTVVWNIQHHASIIPSNEPTWTHINVPLKVERDRAAAEAFSVFRDMHEKVSETATEWGMDALGNMVGAIAGGLMEADCDEIRTLCEDEEHLIRRIQEIAPTVDREDYNTELTDALGRLKHHLLEVRRAPHHIRGKGSNLIPQGSNTCSQTQELGGTNNGKDDAPWDHRATGTVGLRCIVEDAYHETDD